MPVPTQPSKFSFIAAGVVFLSAGVIGLLATWEGRILTVYADKLAGGLPTVCEGITRHVTDTPIIVGEVWTNEKCDAEMARALEKVQRQLRPCFRLTPPQTVFDAATSHAWNLGARRTCGSAAMVAWNRGDWGLGCRRIAFADSGRRVWSFAGGRFVRGLANRREAEMNYCLSGIEGWSRIE